MAATGDHSPRAEAGEMLGNDHLGFSEHLLEVTDAKRRDREQIKDPEPRLVTQAFVNGDQFHAASYKVIII